MKRLRARLRSAVSPHGTHSTRPILTSAVSAVVDFCLPRPWRTLASASGIYAAERFADKTDTNELILPRLAWAKRALQYMREFPRFGIIVVIDAPTPELAERAATDLTRALLTQFSRRQPSRHRQIFRTERVAVSARRSRTLHQSSASGRWPYRRPGGRSEPARKPVAFERSGHLEHGQADGPCAHIHDGGRCPVSTGPDGPSACTQTLTA
jgi:hypothetical protein